MREIPLTRGQVALIDDEDYELVSQYKWTAQWYPRPKTFYAYRSYRKTDGTWDSRGMHTYLMDGMCDHKNHNGLDNRRSNLRLASHSENNMNKRKRAGTSSQYKGVHWREDRQQWYACIKINRDETHLGTFTSEIEAAYAYDDAARCLFGEYAYPNFPSRWEDIEPIPADYDLTA